MELCQTSVLIAISIDVMTPLLMGSESNMIRCLQMIVRGGSGGCRQRTVFDGESWTWPPGWPDDGGMQRLTGWSIGAVRAGLELTVLCAGWMLGGTVGLGTVIFAVGVGYAVAVSLSVVRLFSPDLKNQNTRDSN